MTYLKLSIAVLLSLLLMIPSGAQALSIELSFTGSTLFRDSFFIPPDTMGAAGPIISSSSSTVATRCTEKRTACESKQAASMIFGGTLA